MTSKKQELRQRWKKSPEKELRIEIIRNLGQLDWAPIMKKIQRSNEVEGNFDLRGIDLTGVDLNEEDFVGASLDYAILENITGVGMSFAYCRMKEVSLRGANLRESRFLFSEALFCDFSDAILVDSHLDYANFQGSIFTGADMKGVYVNHATNFEETQGVDSNSFKKIGRRSKSI